MLGSQVTRGAAGNARPDESPGWSSWPDAVQRAPLDPEFGPRGTEDRAPREWMRGPCDGARTPQATLVPNWKGMMLRLAYSTTPPGLGACTIWPLPT